MIDSLYPNERTAERKKKSSLYSYSSRSESLQTATVLSELKITDHGILIRGPPVKEWEKMKTLAGGIIEKLENQSGPGRRIAFDWS